MSTVIVIGGGGGGGQQQNRLSLDGKSIETQDGQVLAVFTSRKDAIRYLKQLEAAAEQGQEI